MKTTLIAFFTAIFISAVGGNFIVIIDYITFKLFNYFDNYFNSLLQRCLHIRLHI